MINVYTFVPSLINLSITASITILFIMAARFLLRRKPRRLAYALWAVALFRLLCPISFGFGWSIFEAIDIPVSQGAASAIEYISPSIVHDEFPSVRLPSAFLSHAAGSLLPLGEEQLRADPLEGAAYIAFLIWLAGFAVMLARGITSYFSLRGRLAEAIPYKENIMVCDCIGSPFVLGIIRPKIYLPSSLHETERIFMTAHERYHIQRLDHITKLLWYFALAVHWWNPIVWISFHMMNCDMEMSCDEAVISLLGDDIRADYSASLLKLAGAGTHSLTPAFGESNTTSRIRHIADLLYPSKKGMIFAYAACVLLALCLISNPKAADGRLVIEGITYYQQEAGILPNGSKNIGTIGSLDGAAPEGIAGYDLWEGSVGLPVYAHKWLPGMVFTVTEEGFSPFVSEGASKLTMFDMPFAADMLSKLDVIGVIQYSDGETETSIGIGNIHAAPASEYLLSHHWTKRRPPLESPPSPGSTELIITDDYRVTVYRKGRLASITYKNDEQWYRADKGAFEELSAIISANVVKS